MTDHDHIYETLPDGSEVCFECNAAKPKPGNTTTETVMTMQPTTMYQVAYGLGARGDQHTTLAAAARARYKAARACARGGDLQSVNIIATDYPADGSDPWGLDRSLNESEMVDLMAIYDAQ